MQQAANAYIPIKFTTLPTTVMPGSRRMPPMPPVNNYDVCLVKDACLWDELVAHGGLVKNCCPQGRPKYVKKPWVDMPAMGRRFRPIDQLAVAVIPFTGTDTLVLEEQVPWGYDGVITDIVCEVVANGTTGFVDGSGDVTWRLAADRRFLRDQGNLQVTIGSLTSPSPTPRGNIRVYSGNHIEFFVSLAAGAEDRIVPSAVIVCSITGWYYPR